MILGGISASVYWNVVPEVYKLGENQVGNQFAGLGVTIGFSLFGLLIGLVLRWFFPDSKSYRDNVHFHDDEFNLLDDNKNEAVTLQKINLFHLKEFVLKNDFDK
jgi:hypothetical protein